MTMTRMSHIPGDDDDDDDSCTRWAAMNLDKSIRVDDCDDDYGVSVEVVWTTHCSRFGMMMRAMSHCAFSFGSWSQ